MDEQNMENIDIEKHKELFAYEMTEVVLKLKGEFAVISGKDTQYWKNRVDDNVLKVAPIAAPVVKFDGISLNVPELKNAPQFSFNVVGSDCPMVQIPQIRSLGNLKTVRLQLDSVSVVVPQVSTFADSLKTCVAAPNQMKPVSVPMVPEIRIPEFHAMEGNEITLDVPTITAFDYHAPEILVKKPEGLFDVGELPTWNPPHCANAVSRLTFPDIPAVPVWNPPVTTAFRAALSYPDIPGVPSWERPVPEKGDAEVFVPSVSKHAPVRIEEWAKEHVSFMIPEVPDTSDVRCDVFPVPQVQTPGIPSVAQVRIPNKAVRISAAVVPEVPKTDLSYLLQGVQSASELDCVPADAVSDCSHNAMGWLDYAQSILKSVKARELDLTENYSAMDAFRNAMQIDTSFTSAEEFFRGFLPE